MPVLLTLLPLALLCLTLGLPPVPPLLCVRQLSSQGLLLLLLYCQGGLLGQECLVLGHEHGLCRERAHGEGRGHGQRPARRARHDRGPRDGAQHAGRHVRWYGNTQGDLGRHKGAVGGSG